MVLNLSDKLKLQPKSKIGIVFSVAVLMIYKIWKFFILQLVSNGTANTHYTFEQYSFTAYRILATVAGLLFLKAAYKNFKSEFRIGNGRIFLINIFFLLPLFLNFHLFLLIFNFNWLRFRDEMFFNLFVATFEEILFRGIFLVALTQYYKPFQAILISAIFFAFWHIDVYQNFSSLAFIFLWGLYAAMCFQFGASLLSLILFHFLWDQIVFGLFWGGGVEVAAQTIDILSSAMFVIAALYFNYQSKKEVAI